MRFENGTAPVREETQTPMTADEYYRAISWDRRRLDYDEALELMQLYMQESGLVGWTAEIERGILPPPFEDHVLGQCYRDAKIIWIDVWAVEHLSPAQWKDVILHEVAHALVGHADDGYHGRVWLAKARELGMRPVPDSKRGYLERHTRKKEVSI